MPEKLTPQPGQIPPEWHDGEPTPTKKTPAQQAQWEAGRDAHIDHMRAIVAGKQQQKPGA